MSQSVYSSQEWGVKMGRKPLLSAQQVAHARKLREQGESPAQVAQLLKVSRRTLERALAATHSKQFCGDDCEGSL